MRQFGEYALMIVVYGVFVHADHAAHLGGVLTGALLGFLLLPRVKGEKLARKQFYALSVVCLSLVSICFFETTAAVDSRSSIQLSRIQLLRGQKRTEEAIIALKDLVQQHPQNAEAFVLLGTCEFELGRSKAAIEDINTALRIDPKSEPALSMKAYYAFQEGDYDKCVEILALIPPNSPYHNINKSYFKSRIDGVNGHLERALDEAAAYPATADKAKMQI
jgi:tetratricopeptide (TPR) repeat protein